MWMVVRLFEASLRGPRGGIPGPGRSQPILDIIKNVIMGVRLVRRERGGLIVDSAEGEVKRAAPQGS
jgi:hypothetical protein